MLMPDKVISA